MKFSANISFLFTESPYLERYQLAKNAGFKAVETGFPWNENFDKVFEAKHNSGLECVLLNLYTGDVSKKELGCAVIPGREKEFALRLDHTIICAKKLNCKKIHLMAGLIDEKFTNEDQMKSYILNMHHAASRLAQEGIIGLIEPINKCSVPGYFINNYEQALDVISKVNSPNLKLLFDIFHCQRIQGDVINSIKNWSQHIGHVQIAQVPNRGEPDTPGELHYLHILAALSNYYQDWVGLEYTPATATKNSLQWIEQYGYKL